jgi:hypothetical protein
MNQRAENLITGRTNKTQELSDLLKRVGVLCSDITASTRELAEIARDSNPGRRFLVRETLHETGADRFLFRVEISLKSLLALEPPIDLLVACEKENSTLRLMIDGGNGS